jgi:hypothetical protein
MVWFSSIVLFLIFLAKRFDKKNLLRSIEEILFYSIFSDSYGVLFYLKQRFLRFKVGSQKLFNFKIVEITF